MDCLILQLHSLVLALCRAVTYGTAFFVFAGLNAECHCTIVNVCCDKSDGQQTWHRVREETKNTDDIVLMFVQPATMILKQVKFKCVQVTIARKCTPKVSGLNAAKYAYGCTKTQHW